MPYKGSETVGTCLFKVESINVKVHYHQPPQHKPSTTDTAASTIAPYLTSASHSLQQSDWRRVTDCWPPWRGWDSSGRWWSREHWRRRSGRRWLPCCLCGDCNRRAGNSKAKRETKQAVPPPESSDIGDMNADKHSEKPQLKYDIRVKAPASHTPLNSPSRLLPVPPNAALTALADTLPLGPGAPVYLAISNASSSSELRSA